MMRKLRGRFSSESDGAVIGFYAKTAPAFLVELSDRCSVDQEKGTTYFDGLVSRYARLAEIKDIRTDEHQRRSDILVLEGYSLSLARKIRNLKRVLRESGGKDRELRSQLARTETQLSEALEEVFVATQQNQSIEINRLAAELREMRRLLQQRDANRDHIVRAQMRDLTGE